MIIMIMSRQIVTMELSAESCSFALDAVVAVASIRHTIVHGRVESSRVSKRRAATWQTNKHATFVCRNINRDAKEKISNENNGARENRIAAPYSCALRAPTQYIRLNYGNANQRQIE